MTNTKREFKDFSGAPIVPTPPPAASSGQARRSFRRPAPRGYGSSDMSRNTSQRLVRDPRVDFQGAVMDSIVMFLLRALWWGLILPTLAAGAVALLILLILGII